MISTMKTMFQGWFRAVSTGVCPYHQKSDFLSIRWTMRTVLLLRSQDIGLFLSLLGCIPLKEIPSMDHDIRHLGAIGDGRTKATAIIQRAIDDASNQGGGRVVVPSGTYLTGSVHLKSRVTLHLEAGAVLRGSSDLADYAIDADQDYAPGVIGPVLIFAKGCDRVGISGTGVIDGDGNSFPKKMDSPRPVLVRFRDCTQVRVRDVTLRDGASWTIHAIGCRQVRYEDLTIHSVLQPTNDGLDIDGCEEVFVRGCSITTSDDAISLKATRIGYPCRDVLISDCRLSSYCQAIRVGPETLADIHRVTATNCVIVDTGMGGICVQAAHGGSIYDLIFNGIVMDMVSNPISVRLGGWREGDANVKVWFLDDQHWQRGQIHDVLFANIRARIPKRYLEGTPKESYTFKENEKTCISVTGTTSTRPQRITFNQVEVTCPGGGTSADANRIIPDLDRQYPTPFMFGVPPAYGLFARHVDDLVLKEVRFLLDSPDARPAAICDDVQRGPP